MASSEFDVYYHLTAFLKAYGWNIICASPPGGTDSRYRKCLLPRRKLGGSEKGPRDEVDLAAYKNGLLIIVECKPTLSHSFSVLNALGENDHDKLKRIVNVHDSVSLATRFRQGTGIAVPLNVQVAPVLAVSVADTAIPSDISVLVFEETTLQKFLKEPLVGQL